MKNYLSLVSKPVRYLGHEINSVRKDPADISLRFCLAFPDVYEVGMSHLGIQILYHILNAKKGVSCERAFAPWVDMEKTLREKDIPLSSLESSTPLDQFDILGFSLQYELSFTNVLNMLDLCRIPFFSKERSERSPLIIAGGPSTFNPEPMADFFDAIVVGDGEDVVLEVCDLAIQRKEANGKKADLLKSLSTLDGVYVPSLHTNGKTVRRRLVPDLNLARFPLCPIVPYMKTVHDRLNLEIARGCKRGCRFCEAGFIHRPYRERSPELIQKILGASLKGTGYEEVSLLSLSAGDYSSIGPLLSALMDRLEPKRVAVSFPSLRIESVVGYLAEEVKRVRKTGFTIAPEAGTERLRKVINKGLDEDVLFEGLADLFSKGWKNIKLYFMIGLPTEREEDLRGIIRLSKKIATLGEKQKVHPNVNISVSTFVPKPHTPFQWHSQIPLEEMKEKLSFLRDELKKSHLGFKWQSPLLSLLEGVFSRGDRRLCHVLAEAHRLGCRFDGWGDQFHLPPWKEAFERMGSDMNAYGRKRGLQEVLPWSFIKAGIEPAFLWKEYQKGLREETSPPCEEDCSRCGVCDRDIRVRESHPVEIRKSPRAGDGWVRRKPMKRKVRLSFTKKGEIRFVSHLELARLFHRASKRADLPLCYSEGFHPMPRIIFATALPVGMESLMEIVDLELEGRIPPPGVNSSTSRSAGPGSACLPQAGVGVAEWVKEKLSQTLPPGIEIIDAKEIPFASAPPSPPHRSVYWISLDHLISREEAIARIGQTLEKSEFLIHQERKGRQRKVDIRPLIERMELKEREREGTEPDRFRVELVLQSGRGRTAKPTEILGAIFGLEEDQLAQCNVIKLE